MTNGDLARSYMARAKRRLKFLQLAFEDDGYPDVVRVAQEIIELALNEDFIPEREYTRDQARRARDDALSVMSVTTSLIGENQSRARS